MHLAAFGVGLVSNLCARIERRRAAFASVPAVIMPMPGSLGIRSIGSLMQRDVLSGVELAFILLLVSAALAGGLLFSNLVISPRKTL